MESTFLIGGVIADKINGEVYYHNLKEHDEILKREVLDELVNKMKSRYFHMVGIQFDNAILEMENIAERLKK